MKPTNRRMRLLCLMLMAALAFMLAGCANGADTAAGAPAAEDAAPDHAGVISLTLAGENGEKGDGESEGTGGED